MHQERATIRISRRGTKLAASAVLAFLVGCGSSADGGGQTPAPAPTTQPPGAAPPSSNPGPTSQPPPPTPDHGSVSTTYPAFTPNAAQLVNSGGATLKNPVVVTITWPNEPNVDAFEKLDDEIGATSYWKTIVSEYGVGAVTSGAANHIRMTTAFPATLTATQVETMVTTNATNGTWPAQTPDTLYVMYFPVGAKLDMGDGSGDACASGTGGYHDDIVSGTKDIPYAVILQCDGMGLDDATVSASHEMAEAATDTLPETKQGWAGLDDAHLSWDLMQRFQDENGDMCEMYEDYLVHTPEMPYALQRQWSNKAAAAGHDPCVPAAQTAYFNSTPLDTLDDLVLDFSSQQGPANQKAKGLKIAVGASRTISVGFFSDAASDPWTLSAIEFDPFADIQDPFGAAPDKMLDVSLDKTTGQNGEKAILTVKVNKASPTGRMILLVSTLGKQSHYMPMLVGGS